MLLKFTIFCIVKIGKNLHFSAKREMIGEKLLFILYREIAATRSKKIVYQYDDELLKLSAARWTGISFACIHLS